MKNAIMVDSSIFFPHVLIMSSELQQVHRNSREDGVNLAFAHLQVACDHIKFFKSPQLEVLLKKTFDKLMDEKRVVS